MTDKRECGRLHDECRTRDQPWRRWYWTGRWRAISRAQLAAHPLCAYCLRQGTYTAATVCDHVEPHRGDPVKFWSGPFQSLCATHHSGTKQSEEATGRPKGSDVTGRPLDPSHPWNRPR
jgi:5-methylcytosine-specific restriction protein A